MADRHPLDGDAIAADTHNGRDPHVIGTTPEDECDRLEEPDGDAPRGYRPGPCRGEMIESDGVVMCDRCGEVE